MDIAQTAGAIFLGIVALYVMLVILLTDEGKAGCFLVLCAIAFIWVAYNIGMAIMNAFGLVAAS